MLHYRKLPVFLLGTFSSLLGVSSEALAAHLGGIDRFGLRTKMPNEGYLAFLPSPNVNRFGEEWTGWIDVRHPSLAGPRDVFLGYDRSDRFVSVRSTILTDSAGIIAPSDRPTDFDYANKAYLLQAGLSAIETANRAIASPAAGMANAFTFPITDNDPVNKNEFSNIESNNGLPPIIDLYYGRLPNRELGSTSYPSGVPGFGNESIVLDNLAPQTGFPDTFAHELYHFVGDGDAVHQPLAEDAGHSSDPRNLIADGSLLWSPGMPANQLDPGQPPFSINQNIGVVGPSISIFGDGSPHVGGVDQITSAQADRIFQPANGAAPFIQNNGDRHAKGDRVDWNFVVDHAKISKDSKDFGLEGLANADPHPGIDDLFWGRGFTVAPFIPAPDANNGGQDNQQLGMFPATPDFPLDKIFRSVDIFSLSTRYSDSDTDSSGNLTLRDGALDYKLFFLGANGQTVPGALIDVFTGGWTDNTAVDNYLGRWLSPIDAVGIFIEAAGLPTHEGTAQIDAVIASDAKVKDFGDAPDSYKTLLASNGPRYDEGFSQRLGFQWDSEIDGQPTLLADGDDRSILGGFPVALDDEDGVIFGDSWVDVIFNIARPDPNPYQLRAWWDTNYNGVFDHTSELYIDDLLTLAPGIFTKRYNLGFNPKADGLYSRFRLTWDPLDLDVKPFGEYYSKADCNTTDAAAGNCISHGEVEDYVHVPEPSSIFGLLAFGGLGLMGLRKKR